MRKSLEKRVQQLIEAERKHPVDEALLNRLREIATEETDYWQLAAEQRNAFNAFFNETKQMMLHELLLGDYGPEILLDATIVLSFEVGHKLGREEREGGAP